MDGEELIAKLKLNKRINIWEELFSQNEIDALEKAGFTQITSSNGGKENYGLFVARNIGKL